MVLLLLASVYLASANHKTLSKFSICDLFPTKKPQVVTASPSSTTPLPVSPYIDTDPGYKPDVLQYFIQPELQNPHQEYSQQQELQNPPLGDNPYPLQQLVHYIPQQPMQYPVQQSEPYSPQPALVTYQPLQLGQQEVQPPSQESQYQSPLDNKDQPLQQEVQPPHGFQPQQQQQEVNLPQAGLVYQPPQQEVQNQPSHEVQKPQLGLKFPLQQFRFPPPQFQGVSNSYGPFESFYHQQQMEPTKKLVVGYFDSQKIFHHLRPYNVNIRQQYPYNY